MNTKENSGKQLVGGFEVHNPPTSIECVWLDYARLCRVVKASLPKGFDVECEPLHITPCNRLFNAGIHMYFDVKFACGIKFRVFDYDTDARIEQIVKVTSESASFLYKTIIEIGDGSNRG